MTDSGTDTTRSGNLLHYVLVTALVVGTTGLILSASLQAWSLVVMFAIGLAFLLFARTKCKGVFTHGA